MDVGTFDYVYKPLGEFAKNSARLVKRCTKPDRKGELRLRSNRRYWHRRRQLVFCGRTFMQAAGRST